MIENYKKFEEDVFEVLQQDERDHKNLKRSYNYNVDAAVRYAKRYALNPNVKEYPYFNEYGGDCTNFMSQILKAGGIPQTGQDYKKLESWFCYTNDMRKESLISLTWSVARLFRRHFGNENGLGLNRAKKYEELTAGDMVFNYDYFYDYIEVGNIVQYGSLKNYNYPYHSQFVYKKDTQNEEILICQHTENRIGVSLYDYMLNLQDVNTPIYLYKF